MRDRIIGAALGAAVGVSTDDTRMSWLLLSLCAELGHAPDGRELAQRYLDVYANPAAYFPTQPELARENLGYFVDAASGVLGTPSPAHPQASPEALSSGALGLGMPTLLGMISLLCAGSPLPQAIDCGLRIN